MTTVKVKDDVRQPVVDKKPKFESVVDSLGRTIQLRKLDPIQQARLVMSVGGDVASNGVYMNGFAMPAAMVAHIDDDFFGLPSSVKEIEAMLAQLGTEGLEAINKLLIEQFEAQEKARKEAALSAEQAAAKN